MIRKQICIFFCLRGLSKGADSNVWLSRNMNDPYIKRSRIEGYRCRSAYKLLELDEKYKLLFSGIKVLDCGAAPGSWSQVISRHCFITNACKTVAVAVDKQFFKPIENIICLSECDILAPTTSEKIRHILGDSKLDLILSDMAPQASGIREIDLANMDMLNQMVLKIAVENSRKGATFVCKMWSNETYSKKMKELVSKFYCSYKLVKPPSSRSDSAELFILARGFNK